MFGNRQALHEDEDVQINGKEAIDAERGDPSTISDVDDLTNDRAASTNEGVDFMDAVDESNKNVDGVKEVHAFLTCEDNVNETNTHAISSPKCSSCSQNKVAVETGPHE